MSLVMFILGQILLSQTTFGTEDGVKPKMEQLVLTNDTIVFQCTVFNYDKKLSVHFNCEFNESEESENRCYENCKSIGGKEVFKKCTNESLGKGIVFKYITNKAALPSGRYYCMYGAKSSHIMAHINDKRMYIMTTLAYSSVSDPRTKIRTEIVLVLLTVLIFSVVLNLVFFMRCFVVSQINGKESSLHSSPTKQAIATCLCIATDPRRGPNYFRTKEDMYDNIHDMMPDSDTTKSKSSSGRGSQNLIITPSSSQLTRSSTFPYKQSVLVNHTSDQIPMQSYMMPFLVDGGQRVVGTVLNHRLSEPSTSIPIQHFASTGSLNHRPKRLVSNQSKASPLLEENQVMNSRFTLIPQLTDDGMVITPNDLSSTYEINSSEEAFASGKESDPLNDPVRSAKLEMSREMMAKADTLLREAHNLLR